MTRQVFHTHALTKPSILAKQLLHRGTRALSGSGSGRRSRRSILLDIFQDFCWRRCPGNASTARKGRRDSCVIRVLTRPLVITTRNEHLAHMNIVRDCWVRSKVNVALGLRVRHVGRLVARLGRWFWWALHGVGVVFGWLRLVEVSETGVALVVEWVELCEIAVRGLSVVF